MSVKNKQRVSRTLRWLAPVGAVVIVALIVVGVFTVGPVVSSRRDGNTQDDHSAALNGQAITFAECVQKALIAKQNLGQDRAAAIAGAFDVSLDLKISNREQAEIIQQVYSDSVQLEVVRGCASAAKQPIAKSVVVSVVTSDSRRPLDDASVVVGGEFERCSTGRGGQGRCRIAISAERMRGEVRFAVQRPGYSMNAADAAPRHLDSELSDIEIRMQYVRPLEITVTRANALSVGIDVKPRYAHQYWSGECERDNKERSESDCTSARTQNGTVRFYFLDAVGAPIVPDPRGLEVELMFGDKRLMCALDARAHVDWEICKAAGKPTCESAREVALRSCTEKTGEEIANCEYLARRSFDMCKGSR